MPRNLPPDQQPGRFGEPTGNHEPPPGNVPPGQQPYGASGPDPRQQVGGLPKPSKKRMSSGTILLYTFSDSFFLLTLFISGCAALTAA